MVLDGVRKCGSGDWKKEKCAHRKTEFSFWKTTKCSVKDLLTQFYESYMIYIKGYIEREVNDRVTERTREDGFSSFYIILYVYILFSNMNIKCRWLCVTMIEFVCTEKK